MKYFIYCYFFLSMIYCFIILICYFKSLSSALALAWEQTLADSLEGCDFIITGTFIFVSFCLDFICLFGYWASELL